MVSEGLSNDTRGWIMCGISGIACIFGSCVVCLDLLIRHFPGKKDFSIQDNNPFLACSLSLSFGVMIYSALHSMLPESKTYLKKDGWDDSNGGLVLMGCFIVGFIGIQVISRLLHQFMPSHVVDCDHTHNHDDANEDHKHPHSRSRSHSYIHSHSNGLSRHPSRGRPTVRGGRRITTTTGLHANGHKHNGHATESTPLIRTRPSDADGASHATTEARLGDRMLNLRGSNSLPHRRPSMMAMRDRVVSFVKDTKPTCDAEGPCFGYSDPCGQECFKHLSSRSALSRQRSTGAFDANMLSPFNQNAPLFERISEGNSEDDSGTKSPMSPRIPRTSCAQIHEPPSHHEHHDHDHEQHENHELSHATDEDRYEQMSVASSDLEAQDQGAHHHHVPTNAFLSIGLQTVIAIALHKFPEGFITYATNHANPQLGFNVFMALFVHNIAEGFSMALPLYMAFGSRLRAIAWTSLLGGFSQPLGAAVAWLVFKVAGRGDNGDIKINNTAYAALFAATAGIMVSVALQLFVESLSLNHNRNLSIAFAFLGMVLLGISGAIAGHH